MKKTISQALQENKKFLRENFISLNYIRSLIISENNILLICLDEYLREYYNSDIKLFVSRYGDHESFSKLYIEMKAKEMGLIHQDKKSFNI